MSIVSEIVMHRLIMPGVKGKTPNYQKTNKQTNLYVLYILNKTPEEKVHPSIIFNFENKATDLLCIKKKANSVNKHDTFQYYIVF